MTFLTKNPDDSILDITNTDETGTGIEIMLGGDSTDMDEIKANRFGHSVFDYIDGSIVLNTTRQAAMEFPEIVEDKLTELRVEAVRRMREQVTVRDFDEVELTREFWLSITPAARQPTVGFQWVIDVYQAGKDAVIIINGMTDIATIEAYDVITTPNWPA